MGFASAEGAWQDVPIQPTDESFPTVDAAEAWACNEYSEYGVSVHPECYEPQRQQRHTACKQAIISKLADEYPWRDHNSLTTKVINRWPDLDNVAELAAQAALEAL